MIAWMKKEWPSMSALTLSVVAAVSGFAQNKGGVREAVLSGGGLLGAAIVAAAHKLASGKVDVANLTSIGQEFASDLPALRADVQKAVSFAEGEFPSLKGVVTDVTGRLAVVEGRVIPGVKEIENLIRATIAEWASRPPAPAAGPAAPETTV